MFRVFATLAGITFSLVACGPSADERKRIASRACSEIMGTRNFESSKRASIWNDAVDKIGLKGAYWDSHYSEINLKLSITADGAYSTESDCVTSLSQGNVPLGTD